jgi:hypothetical protein
LIIYFRAAFVYGVNAIPDGYVRRNDYETPRLSHRATFVDWKEVHGSYDIDRRSPHPTKHSFTAWSPFSENKYFDVSDPKHEDMTPMFNVIKVIMKGREA